MIRVGIAGIGFMGMIHYVAYERLRGARVTAIATRDRKRRSGDWRGIQGNFGPPGQRMDLSKVAQYASLNELLDDDSVDLVDLCLPPSLHAPAAIAALRAGKHVVCEKPIALTPGDARRMVAAADGAGRQLYVAHVLPYFAEYQYVQRTVQSGKYGKMVGGRFQRIISDPTWLKDFYDPRATGGPIVDLHIHDAHFVRMLCGMPRAVFASGRERGEVVQFMESQWLYDDGPTIAMTSGVIAQQGRAFTHGFEIHLERATLLFSSAVIGGEPQVQQPLTVLTPKGRVEQPKLKGGDPVDAFVAELRDVCRAAAEHKASSILGSELARDALTLCHKSSESVRRGRLVKI